MRAGLWLGTILAAALAQAAGANGLDRLAAPGPCAEPDLALRGEPDDGFDVAGGPRDHFDPTDVAAAGAPPFVPPGPTDLPRGPCDAPTTGCADVLAERGQGVVDEPDPSPGPGPVFPPQIVPPSGGDGGIELIHGGRPPQIIVVPGLEGRL